MNRRPSVDVGPAGPLLVGASLALQNLIDLRSKHKVHEVELGLHNVTKSNCIMTSNFFLHISHSWLRLQWRRRKPVDITGSGGSGPCAAGRICGAPAIGQQARGAATGFCRAANQTWARVCFNNTSQTRQRRPKEIRLASAYLIPINPELFIPAPLHTLIHIGYGPGLPCSRAARHVETTEHWVWLLNADVVAVPGLILTTLQRCRLVLLGRPPFAMLGSILTGRARQLLAPSRVEPSLPSLVLGSAWPDHAGLPVRV